jgi:hypothetical protein
MEVPARMRKLPAIARPSDDEAFDQAVARAHRRTPAAELATGGLRRALVREFPHVSVRQGHHGGELCLYVYRDEASID